MSHSYDQTLLQRMGFSDPDRKTPAHDNACIAIATEPERFARKVQPRFGMRGARCRLEVPLQKGTGQYAATIGFIDAVIEWDGEITNDEWHLRTLSGDKICACWRGEQFVPWSKSGNCYCLDLFPGPAPAWIYKYSMLVEVKTSIDSIGMLLRQMNLYREYAKHDEYVVFSLNREDGRYGELLKQQGYTLLVRT